MSVWSTLKLGAVGRVITGKTPPTKQLDLYGDVYPFITPTDISDNSVHVHFPDRYLSEKGAFYLKSSRLPKNSICYTCIASIGKIAITTKDSFTNQQITSIIVEPTKHSFQFLFYLLKQKTPQIKLMAGGVASPIVNKTAFQNIEVYVPDLKTQTRIASVLSAYDDLIENNEKRIKVLEEMAQLLYTEWFVKFKFPGHEKVKMVDSGTEYGKVSEGWAVKSTQECFEVVGGGTPDRRDSSNWIDGSINWFTPTDITRFNQIFLDESSEKITESGLNTSSAKLFPPFSIMMTSRATIGAISINTTVASTNQGFIVCIPSEKVPLYYLYHWLCGKVPSFSDLASGATFKELSRGAFKKINILVPEASVLNEFEEKVQFIYKLIMFSQRQISNLSKTRDLLVPQLVTGKRAVK